MKIKLYSDTKFSPIPTKAQICLNRGMSAKDVPIYLKNSFNEINSAEAFGEDLLKQSVKMLMTCISANQKAFLIVDSDVDGMTSAAHMINYLYELFPAWTENNLEWGLHEGKQHGINDFVDTLVDCEYALLIVPDAGTNDVEAIEKLHNVGTNVLILDHHISDVPMSPYSIVINSQYNYPNKELSGAGVVHKFCKYMDKLLGQNSADKFKDLTATGLMADMMNIQSLETKEMIFDGFQDKNICNPLIYGLKEKSAFALSKADYTPSASNNLAMTPMGAAFFIIPLMNALCRSGTMEEKELVFKAMLTMKAFKEIPSTKRGHKLGEMEQVVTQALRVCTNVKNRQTRAEDAGMELLIAKAEEMLDNKVLVFTLEPGQIDPNIAGLVANKLMAKYQRPVCVTTKVNEYKKDSLPWEDDEVIATNYQGSMRGYTATGIADFKKVAETSEACNWVRGHENAAGISLNDPARFLEDMNSALKDISTDIVYYVDYIYDADNIDGQAVIDMAEMNDYLGTGFPRPLVYIENCKIQDFMIMKEKHLKINLPGCDAIMWDAPEEMLERLKDGEIIIMNFVAKCNINEFNWQRNPQLIIEDWEEKTIEETNITPAAAWGF